MPEELQIRVYGPPTAPTLIYLPGTHGDWTLVTSFRHALGDRVRFVEFTYPRTLTWSLDDYAAAIESALAGERIQGGWLLGESFGSQVGWAILNRGRLAVEGVILAGGFIRHPILPGVRFAERILSRLSIDVVRRLPACYASLAGFRFRKAPEVLAGLQEFLDRRTDEDRRAAVHRLALIAESDWRLTARKFAGPVYALAGFWDPIVPWCPVWRWLKANSPALRARRLLFLADHTVLATAPRAAAKQILRWVRPEWAPVTTPAPRHAN